MLGCGFSISHSTYFLFFKAVTWVITSKQVPEILVPIAFIELLLHWRTILEKTGPTSYTPNDASSKWPTAMNLNGF